MDDVDRAIVHHLQEDGRLSQMELAHKVCLSRPAVHARIKRLESLGLIRGYRAIVDWDALGWTVTAFIWIRTTTRCAEAGRHIMAICDDNARIEECHRVTGDWCMLAKVRATSPRALQDLIDIIREVPSVHGTMTTMALSTLDDGMPESPPRT